MGGYVYSLGQKCISEGFGMMMIIYLGESVLANELLAKTHGHEVGWVWVALGFGMAFGVPITLFNFCTAYFNPAMLTARWILGDINGVTWITLFVCEFVGGFLGAVLVWLHYLPHFKTIPEPPPTDAADNLLRPRDYLNAVGLRLAGYNTGPDALRDDNVKLKPRAIIQDLRHWVRRDAFKDAEGKVMTKAELLDTEGHLRRRSVQVADLHRRLSRVDLKPLEQDTTIANGAPHEDADGGVPASAAAMCHTHADGSRHTDSSTDSSSSSDTPFASHINGGQTHGQRSTSVNATKEGHDKGGHAAAGTHTQQQQQPNSAVIEQRHSMPHLTVKTTSDDQATLLSPEEQRMQEAMEKREQVYAAALRADQNAKLSIFATRPAIYSPVFNFLTEFIATTALIGGALLIVERGEQVYPTAKGLWGPNEGIYLGLFIFVFVLAWGGPTGVACNIARDTAPRLAHWLLPIPNKGPSEWYYAPIPFFASLAGGAAGAGVYLLINMLNKSNVEAPVIAV